MHYRQAEVHADILSLRGCVLTYAVIYIQGLVFLNSHILLLMSIILSSVYALNSSHLRVCIPSQLRRDIYVCSRKKNTFHHKINARYPAGIESRALCSLESATQITLFAKFLFLYLICHKQVKDGTPFNDGSLASWPQLSHKNQYCMLYHWSLCQTCALRRLST